MFLSFDHVAFVSQWSLYTRNEKYTEIVLSIKFAVTNGLKTLWTHCEQNRNNILNMIRVTFLAFNFIFVTKHEYSKAW